jgi:CBS-domain-containing membrane protein
VVDATGRRVGLVTRADVIDALFEAEA